MINVDPKLYSWNPHLEGDKYSCLHLSHEFGEGYGASSRHWNLLATVAEEAQPTEREWELGQSSTMIETLKTCLAKDFDYAFNLGYLEAMTQATIRLGDVNGEFRPVLSNAIDPLEVARTMPWYHIIIDGEDDFYTVKDAEVIDETDDHFVIKFTKDKW